MCEIDDVIHHFASTEIFIFLIRLWGPPHSRSGENRGRRQIQVRRLAVAGASQRVHLAGTLHQEQMRRCSNLRQTCPNCSSLSTRVSYIQYVEIKAISFKSISCTARLYIKEKEKVEFKHQVFILSFVFCNSKYVLF